MDQLQSNEESDEQMVNDARVFTERLLRPLVQRLLRMPVTSTRQRLALEAHNAAVTVNSLLTEEIVDSTLNENQVYGQPASKERIIMIVESMTPSDMEMIEQIQALTGWKQGATRAFIAHVDRQRSVLDRKRFVMRRFIDWNQHDETIPLSVFKMQNHHSTERVRREGNTTYERVDYQVLPIPEPEYRTPGNQLGLAVWTIYSQTRSEQSRESSASLMRRQLSAA